ncbi:hypothetical protein [Streptomyces sp. NPDC050145]|uniref:hypothetical protein n=1 Tax=Streptomyces sp. NPDC050145 TaxID=3365602 RepID=UPI0037B27579
MGNSLVLAGALEDLGNNWIDMFAVWADKGLKVALAVIVLYVLVTRFSLKAGVGALLLMMLALGLYGAREDGAKKVEDEVTNGAAPTATRYGPARGEIAPGVRVPGLDGGAL